MCLRSSPGRKARADCCLWDFLVGGEAGLPGATVLPQVLPQASVHTVRHCYQALLHHQDHSRGSAGVRSGAKACVGPSMFSHIDNVKLPEDALPVMSSVGKVFPRGDLMEPACRKHLFCLFPPPPLLFFFFTLSSSSSSSPCICPSLSVCLPFFDIRLYHRSCLPVNWPHHIRSSLRARWQVCGSVSATHLFLFFNSYVFSLATWKLRDL